MLSLRYILLVMIGLGLPSFILVTIGETPGSYSSHAMFLLLLVYYFLSRKSSPPVPFIILGLMYYLISAFQGIVYYDDFINEFVKYLIFVLCAGILVVHTSLRTLIWILAIGAISIGVHALIFPDNYGRYSGFYLNPNGAGFICIIGYALSYGITDKKHRLIFQALFTIAGLLTFSRTFLLLWILISIVAALVRKTYVINLSAGFGLFVLFLSYTFLFDLNQERLTIFQGLLNPENQIGYGFQSSSRISNWSMYYEMIVNNPIFGNGFKTLGGLDNIKQGVHNSYLMILGEAGIFPFLLFIFIYFKILARSLTQINTKPELFLVALVLIGLFFVYHNYFTSYVILFVSLWISHKLKPTEDLIETKPV